MIYFIFILILALIAASYKMIGTAIIKISEFIAFGGNKDEKAAQRPKLVFVYEIFNYTFLATLFAEIFYYSSIYAINNYSINKSFCIVLTVIWVGVLGYTYRHYRTIMVGTCSAVMLYNWLALPSWGIIIIWFLFVIIGSIYHRKEIIIDSEHLAGRRNRKERRNDKGKTGNRKKEKPSQK